MIGLECSMIKHQLQVIFVGFVYVIKVYYIVNGIIATTFHIIYRYLIVNSSMWATHWNNLEVNYPCRN